MIILLKWRYPCSINHKMVHWFLLWRCTSRSIPAPRVTTRTPRSSKRQSPSSKRVLTPLAIVCLQDAPRRSTLVQRHGDLQLFYWSYLTGIADDSRHGFSTRWNSIIVQKVQVMWTSKQQTTSHFSTTGLFKIDPLYHLQPCAWWDTRQPQSSTVSHQVWGQKFLCWSQCCAMLPRSNWTCAPIHHHRALRSLENWISWQNRTAAANFQRVWVCNALGGICQTTEATFEILDILVSKIQRESENMVGRHDSPIAPKHQRKYSKISRLRNVKAINTCTQTIPKPQTLSAIFCVGHNWVTTGRTSIHSESTAACQAHSFFMRHVRIKCVCIYIHTGSAAQGGGGSFKNRKPIGEVGCCESWMAERIHWWTEGWLELCFLEWLQWLRWSPHHNCWM